MSGRWTTLEEIDQALSIKLGKMVSQVGNAALKELGKTRKSFRQEIAQSLKTGKEYVLDPNKMFRPKLNAAPTSTLAQEYGLQ